MTIYTSGFGITAGVHRLWSHKAYKAKWPLRLLLVFLFTITGQVCKLSHNSDNFWIIKIFYYYCDKSVTTLLLLSYKKCNLC